MEKMGEGMHKAYVTFLFHSCPHIQMRREVFFIHPVVQIPLLQAQMTEL